MSIKRNWLVVANAARARVLEEGDELAHYTHVADLVHPESRLQGKQLEGDRPGRVAGVGHGLGNVAYRPRTDPRVREHDNFAREVADCLNKGVASGRCAGLTLVASDPFLGQLKSHLGVQSRKLLLRTVAADYTALRDDALAGKLTGS